MYYFGERTVRIPVKVVNKQLKYFYGGDLPELKEGVIGELILPEYSVKDKRFLEVSQKEEKIEVLPERSIIMVAVNNQNSPDDKKSYLKTIKAYPPTSYAFVEIILCEPLNLIIRGSKKANLDGVKCFIPSLDIEASSLNDAYSKISQVFEPKRISHTGNVFNKCYYMHDNNWRQLDYLRENEEGKYEESLFLDYKVFIVNNNDKILYNKLSEHEQKLFNAITDKGITGIEIKELFNNDKKVYIEVINNLINKGLIIERKE